MQASKFELVINAETARMFGLLDHLVVAGEQHRRISGMGLVSRASPVLPANLKGGAAQRVVDKLRRSGLLEEVRARGSLPIWRHDDESGPIALRITKSGLEAIAVEDEGTTATKEPSIGNAADREVEEPAPEAIASRKHVSVAAKKSTHKKNRQGKARPTPFRYPKAGRARNKLGCW